MGSRRPGTQRQAGWSGSWNRENIPPESIDRCGMVRTDRVDRWRQASYLFALLPAGCRRCSGSCYYVASVAPDVFLPNALGPKLRRFWQYKRGCLEELDPNVSLTRLRGHFPKGG